MNDRVTAREIADLLDQLRSLRPPAQGGDPAERAAFLTRKAELLTRIADQHTDDWPSRQTAQALQTADNARAAAAQARGLAASPHFDDGAKSQENLAQE